MTETNGTERVAATADLPRRWGVLVVWVLLLAMVIVAQRLTVGTFETGHWEGGTFTPATVAEKFWYRLPLVLIGLISLAFFIGSRWLVKGRSTRSITRAWGVVGAIFSLLVSVGMSAWYYLIWYMD